MVPSPDLLLYRYNVAVQPAATGKKLNQIIKLLLKLPKYAEFQDIIVTDYKYTLVSCKRLSPDAAELVVQYRAEGEDEPRANAQNYRLRVEDTGTLTDFLGSTNLNSAFADKQPVLQALNIFLGHYAKLTPAIATVGRSKSFSLSDTSPKWDLGAGLSALRGFFSSVRVATCRILVNVNISHGAFYDAIPLDQLIQKYGSANQFNRMTLQSFLKRVRVKVIHLPEKKNKEGISIQRVKTVFGLASKDDGHGLDHPPRVQDFGAGPKDVEFFLNDSSGAPSSSSTSQAGGTTGSRKKGKGNNQPVSRSGRYISVYDFFQTGICSTIILLFTFVTK